MTTLWSYFWPVKTGRTFLDVWSVVHFAFWLIVGADIRALTSTQTARIVGFEVCVVLAYAWEVFERLVLEPRGFVAHPESLVNRWLSDPLMCVLGVGAGMWMISKQ